MGGRVSGGTRARAGDLRYQVVLVEVVMRAAYTVDTSQLGGGGRGGRSR